MVIIPRDIILTMKEFNEFLSLFLSWKSWQKEGSDGQTADYKEFGFGKIKSSKKCLEKINLVSLIDRVHFSFQFYEPVKRSEWPELSKSRVDMICSLWKEDEKELGLFDNNDCAHQVQQSKVISVTSRFFNFLGDLLVLPL